MKEDVKKVKHIFTIKLWTINKILKYTGFRLTVIRDEGEDTIHSIGLV